MKSRTSILSVLTVCLALPFSVGFAAAPKYVANFLGNDGGDFAVGFSVLNTNGYVGGEGALPNSSAVHALEWRDSSAIDLGTLGGPSSGLFGTMSGTSDTAKQDPLGQKFCGDPQICLAFQLNGLTLVKLPTLGGYNAAAFSNNTKNQIVGIAQGPGRDPTCMSGSTITQDIYPVIWQNGQITTTIPFLPGDVDAQANSINDAGQVVGSSGDCSDIDIHSWIWKNSQVTDLGSLGGVDYTFAASINNYAQVTGGSDLAGDEYTHAFLWQNGVMTDLGTLPGDVYSEGYWINNVGQIVGQSCDEFYNCRAFLWQNNKMYDLNKLITNDAQVDFYFARFITDIGDITGEAYNYATDTDGAFLAIASSGSTADDKVEANAEAGARVNLPERVRMRHQQHLLNRGKLFGGRLSLAR